MAKASTQPKEEKDQGTPEEEPQAKITNFRLLRKWNALSILGQRFLPSVDSDMKIAKLLQLHEALGKIVEVARNRISLDILEPLNLAKLSGLENERIQGMVFTAQAEFDKKEQDYEKPKWVVTKADLPKEKSGDDGWINGSGLGKIISDLGDLFEHPKE